LILRLFSSIDAARADSAASSLNTGRSCSARSWAAARFTSDLIVAVDHAPLALHQGDKQVQQEAVVIAPDMPLVHCRDMLSGIASAPTERERRRRRHGDGGVAPMDALASTDFLGALGYFHSDGLMWEPKWLRRHHRKAPPYPH
jgi:hypothetical protein